MLERGSIDFLKPDISHTGGITKLKKIASMAEAYDMGVAPHSPLGPVNFAASLHVDTVAHNAVVHEQILHCKGTPTYLADESLLAYENGSVALPEDPWPRHGPRRGCPASGQWRHGLVATGLAGVTKTAASRSGDARVDHRAGCTDLPIERPGCDRRCTD